MLNQQIHAALRYEPSVEAVADDEAETNQALSDTMHKVSEATFRHEGRANRSVHAKSHALLQGELEVAGGLEPVLAQGLFAEAGRYPVVLRFSTIPGDVLDDSVSTPRGVALKVVGVDGARLPGSEGHATQDFVLVNGPAFGAPTPKAFLANLKLLAATTDRGEGAKKFISGALQGVNAAVKGVTGSPSPMLSTLGGQAETHILGDSFYSQTAVPLRRLHRQGETEAREPRADRTHRQAPENQGCAQRLAGSVHRALSHRRRGMGAAGAALHRRA